MHMPTVESLLVRLFESRGYQVATDQVLPGASGTQYRVPLLARGPRDTVLVWTSLGEPVGGGDVQELTAAVHDTGADLGVVAALAGAEPVAVTTAAHGRVEVWSRGRFALELGESMLEGVADAVAPPRTAVRSETPETAPVAAVPTARAEPRKFASLIQQAAAVASGPPSQAAIFLPSKPVERAAAPPGPLAYAWGAPPGGAGPNATFLPSKATRHLEVPQIPLGQPASAQTHAPARVESAPLPPPPRPEVARPETGQALAARIDESRVRTVAEARVGAVRETRLVLEPAIAFSWAWAGWVEPGKPPVETKGVLLVSGAEAMREVAEPAWEPPTDGAERGAVRVEAVDVYDRVKGRLLRKATKEVKVERVIGDEQIFEKRRVGPRSPDEMDLQHHGVVYVPTWIVRGERGETRVDAFSGEILGDAEAAPPAAPKKDSGAQIL